MGTSAYLSGGAAATTHTSRALTLVPSGEAALAPVAIGQAVITPGRVAGTIVAAGTASEVAQMSCPDECGGDCPGGDAPRGIEHLPKSQQRAVRSLQQRAAEHQQKLADYLKNPDAFDNQGLLRNAPTPEIRQRIIDGRVRHLEQEIKAFQDQIDNILGGS